jgi:hypothetical protein
MATEQQIARLRTWNYPGDPARLSTEEARDVIYTVHSWLIDHRDDYSRPSGPDDTWTFFEDEAFADYWNGTNSPGNRLLRNIRHARNMRRNEPHLVQMVGRWVQSIPITAALRHDLGHGHLSHSDYRIAESRGDWFLSIWADSEQQLTERVVRVQAILASADSVTGLKQIWAEECAANAQTQRLALEWTVTIHHAHSRATTQEEYESVLSTIRQQMLADEWQPAEADKWIAHQTNEYLKGQPKWKRMLVSQQ